MPRVLCFFFLMIRRPPRSTRTDTLFPYTTLFRSLRLVPQMRRHIGLAHLRALPQHFFAEIAELLDAFGKDARLTAICVAGVGGTGDRSSAFGIGQRDVDAAGEVVEHVVRSAERRVGTVCVSTFRSRGAAYPSTTKKPKA